MFPRRLLPLLPLFLLVVLVAARPARADEPGALDRLTPAEVQTLTERVPGWATLPAEQREHIAKNVIRLRSLGPEERARLETRMRELERHRERLGRLPGMEGLRNPAARDAMRQRGLLVHALGLSLLAALPEEARSAIEKNLPADSRPDLEAVFFHHFWEACVKRHATADPSTIEIPSDLPALVQRRLATLRERASSGDAGARRRLAHFVFGREMIRLHQGLAPVDPGDEDALRAIGDRLREAEPEAFQEAMEELEKAVADPESLNGYALRERRERLLHLRDALRDARPFLDRDPALRDAARRLGQALERALGLAGPPGPPGEPGAGPGPGPGRGPRGGPGRGHGPGAPGHPDDKHSGEK